MNDDVTKVVKGTPLLVMRKGSFRVGVSGGGLRKGQKKIKLSALGMKKNIYVPASTEFVPVTILVSKEVADLLKPAED